MYQILCAATINLRENEIEMKTEYNVLTWISVQLRGQPSVGVIHSLGAAEIENHISEVHSQTVLDLYIEWYRINVLPTCSLSPRT